MYSIEFSLIAERQFYKLEKIVQERIINVLDRIRVRPFYFVKRKQGTPYFILRVRDYRLILDIREDKNTIFAVELGHRKNIYEY